MVIEQRVHYSINSLTPKQEGSQKLSYVSSLKSPGSEGQAGWTGGEWCQRASASHRSVWRVSLKRSWAVLLRAEEIEGGCNLSRSQRAQNMEGLHFQWQQSPIQDGSSMCLSSIPFIPSTNFYFTLSMCQVLPRFWVYFGEWISLVPTHMGLIA